MKATLYSQDGKAKGDIDLPKSVFETEINDAVLHLVIKSLLQNMRQGTSNTKGRAEVSGGGRKPWKQKGTGHARAGSNTSPVWVRGAKAHGPAPRDFRTTIPRAMRLLALRSSLSHRARDLKIMVVDGIVCDKPKTKTISLMLSALNISLKKTLIVVDSAEKNTMLAGRNIANLRVKKVSDINAHDVMASENIIFSAPVLIKRIEEVVS